jgi:hypothetical protein
MDNTMKNSKSLLNLIEHKIQQVDDYHFNIAEKMIRCFLKSDMDQRVLASTFDREDMSELLDLTKNDTIPHENNHEDDDDGDDDPGVLEDDRSESSIESEVVNHNEEDVNHFKLGDHMVAVVWKKRSEKLRTNISIAGWICSSHPLVMKDVNDNHCCEHRHAVTKLLQKWYMHEVQYNDIKMGEIINRFWQEFEEFLIQDR